MQPNDVIYHFADYLNYNPNAESIFGHKPNQKYNHAEAFCWMYYETEDKTKGFWIFNPRDGVTPFIANAKDGSGDRYSHLMNKDIRRPEYVPKKGDRIWVDMDEDAAKAAIQKRLDGYKGTQYEVSTERYETVFNSLVKDYMSCPTWRILE